MLKVEVRGTKSMQDVFEAIGPREATNLMGATVRGVVGELRDDVRKSGPSKATGDLSRNIKTKARRLDRGFLRVDLVALRDPAFYWRFLEYGTEKYSGAARGWIQRAAVRLEIRLPEILERQFKKKLVAAIKRALKRQAKGA